jgi:hypothetical protein
LDDETTRVAGFEVVVGLFSCDLTASGDGIDSYIDGIARLICIDVFGLKL